MRNGFGTDCLPARRAIELNQSLGGGVLLAQRLVVMERRGDLLSELLAELDSPLIVGVDAPNGALDERDVLVHGDELTEGERGQRVAENGGRGTVAREDAG